MFKGCILFVVIFYFIAVAYLSIGSMVYLVDKFYTWLGK